MKLSVRCEETVLLRTFLRQQFDLSTNALKRLKFRENGICVNGENVTVRYLLHPGDLVALDTDDRTGTDVKREGEFSSVIPADLPLGVVYEDACVTVCDKPGNMPTHPSHGHLTDTAANALAYRALQRGDSAYVFRPVNRLDRNTSGLFLCAGDFLSSGILGRQMREGKIRKTYLAILCGVPKALSGTVNAPIERADVGTMMRVVREDGAPAVTDYRVLEISPDGRYSLCELCPKTGRTHQIRVHMAYLGCPLLGDEIYGAPDDRLPRHALHASRLEFDHPQDGRHMDFSSAIPKDMEEIYRILFY